MNAAVDKSQVFPRPAVRARPPVASERGIWQESGGFPVKAGLEGKEAAAPAPGASGKPQQEAGGGRPRSKSSRKNSSGGFRFINKPINQRLSRLGLSLLLTPAIKGLMIKYVIVLFRGGGLRPAGVKT